MQGAVVHNWFGSITSSPRVVIEVESVDEIIAILKDRERYPTPVRAVGSTHSTTECGVAEGGTLIVMRKMDRIIEIRDDTVTAQAGALYIDVNYELAKAQPAVLRQCRTRQSERWQRLLRRHKRRLNAR